MVVRDDVLHKKNVVSCCTSVKGSGSRGPCPAAKIEGLKKKVFFENSLTFDWKMQSLLPSAAPSIEEHGGVIDQTFCQQLSIGSDVPADRGTAERTINAVAVARKARDSIFAARTTGVKTARGGTVSAVAVSPASVVGRTCEGIRNRRTDDKKKNRIKTKTTNGDGTRIKYKRQ